MKITINSTHVDEKKWTKGDRSGVIRTQEAMAECPRFRSLIRLDLGKADPFPVGDYNVDLEANVMPNQYGDLQLARNLKLDLVAHKPALKSA